MIKRLFVWGIVSMFLMGCHPNNSVTFQQTFNCANNKFLEQYGCSFNRIAQAAQQGDPDAQYALGYMYFYGVGAMQDVEIAKQWIVRAANQGQPLAIRALRILNRKGYVISGEQTQILPVKKSTSSVKRQESSLDANGSPSLFGGARKNDFSLYTTASAVSQAEPARANTVMRPLRRTDLLLESKGYTIQWMVASNLSLLRQFELAHSLPFPRYYYVKSARLYKLIGGTYPTSRVAQQALKQSPDSSKVNRPWVKSYQSIKQELSRS